jgi:transposase
MHSVSSSKHKSCSPRQDRPYRYAPHLINKLFGLERELKETDTEQRHLGRQHHSQSLLNPPKAWLDKTQPQVTAQNALSKAVNHLASNWSRLVRYL